MLRGTTSISQGVFDQWGIIQSGMYAIRDTNIETWTRSFDAFNLNPRTWVSFQEWVKNIGCFLQASQSFMSGAVNTYLLLPTF